MGQEGEPWEGQVREGSGHMGLEGGSLGGGVGDPGGLGQKGRGRAGWVMGRGDVQGQWGGDPRESLGGKWRVGMEG